MENELTKKYGLATAISMVIGIVIGSGIFFKAQNVLSLTNGNMPLGILAWIIGGLIMIVCAYCFSILATKYNKVNGIIDYAEATCGEKYAYRVGWFMSTIYTPCMTSVLAWVSARYTLAIFGDFNVASGRCLALAGLYLILSYAINSLAPKLAGKLQVGSTVIKLVPILLMAVVGTIYGLTVTPEGSIAPQLISNFGTFNNSGLESLFGAVVATAFAYEGWILATTINQEIKDAKKNLPKALILGTLVVIIAYIVYYIGIAGGASTEVLINDGAPVAFRNIFGDIGGTILNVFIAISCLGTLNGLMLSCIRNMYSIAKREQGPKPEVLKQIDASTNMPTNSAIVGVLLCAFWLFYFYIANLDTVLVGTYAAQDANWLIRFLGAFDTSTNTYAVNWFAFDSSELPIVCIYLFYIPIFIKMFKMNDLSKVKRILVPILGLLGSAFMVFAAIYSHKIGVIYFLIVFLVVMCIGEKFRNNNIVSEKENN